MIKEQILRCSMDVNISAECDDINDVFESIAFSEQKVSDSAFEEGFVKGVSEGEVEGYHLGYHRGAEVGAEIGYYSGCIDALCKVDSLGKHNNPKCIELMHKIKNLINSFPRHNADNVDIIFLRDNIRAQFKRLCSLLKVDLSVRENTVSF